MATKHGWYQISIRGLLICAAIVALGLLLHIERAKRLVAEERLSRVLPGPHLRIHSPDSLTEEFWTQGTFGVSGRLHLPADFFLKQPSVEVELLDPTSGKPVLAVRDSPIQNGDMLDFGCDLRCEGLVTPGLFPVSVSVSDGGKVIANAVTVMRFVDLPVAASPNAEP